MKEAKQKKEPTPPCFIFPHGTVEGQVDQHKHGSLTTKEAWSKSSFSLMELEAQEGQSGNRLE